MMILVDTPIWSLSLRRRPAALNPEQRGLTAELAELIREGGTVMLGVVRQEVLSGIRDPQQFERLRAYLRAFDDTPFLTSDYERAAAGYNLCRARGIQGSQVDFLVCAVAERLDVAIFTTDGDYAFYAQHLPIRLHRVRPGLT